ncbi:MAG: cytochrome c biogenesis protein ResB [Phycisphaerae bacterium]|nr:cytochrome c biogenesis protein ResB [Phycisphaerae bacterium]
MASSNRNESSFSSSARPGVPAAADARRSTGALLLFLAFVCCVLLGMLSIFATFLPVIHAHSHSSADCDHGGDGVAGGFWAKFPVTAAELFHSPALVVVWIFVFMTLVASLLFVRGLWRRPAAVAMHLGAILILGGSMWSSPRGHLAASVWVSKLPALATWIDGGRVPRGVMVVHEGVAESHVRLRDATRVELPFTVRLRDFRMEYYGPWELHAAVPVLGRAADGSAKVVIEDRRLDWQIGQPLNLPESHYTITPVAFLPHARLVWPDDVPADLLIMGPGVAITLPAQSGRRASFTLPAGEAGPGGYVNPLLPKAAATITIDRLINTADPHSPLAPSVDAEETFALLATLEFSDGPTRRLVFSPQSPREDRGVTYAVAIRRPQYVADPTSDLPAMDLKLTSPDLPGGTMRFGHFLDATGTFRGMPPMDVPMTDADVHAFLDDPDAPDIEGIRLFFVEPPVKGFFSDVEIIEDGQVVKRATIAVNRPLHHRGYHFYQMDWDKERHAYTVLGVVSDQGLWAVLAGFGLMLLGVFWRYWFSPTVGYFRRRDAGILPASGVEDDLASSSGQSHGAHNAGETPASRDDVAEGR